MTVPSGNFVARFVRDCFVQIRIEFLADRIDRLQTIFGQKILELFEHQTHARIDWRFLAFASGGLQSELEIVDDRNEFFEQRCCLRI